ncbi:MAG: carboxylate-amine ligase [Rhodospirillaceae bacterium]|nr:MAG: carboxylate-amine ligase [Rhodospirillaceae bacterium]
MTVKEPRFTIGIEEEYLLVDLKTRALASEPPSEMLAKCDACSKGLVQPEFLKAQIEVGTKVCTTAGEARTQLAGLRGNVADVAGEYGLAPIAASTHPFASWKEQVHTDKARYHALAEELQSVVRRLLICGMHVHVGVEDDDLRIDLLNQASYFLPHLLALSTSSPFWRGADTGLKSYRLSVFDELPRSGLPERFDTFDEYERHVKVLTDAGVIPDSSMLWWDIRPSKNYPTLELRITDVCTRLDDAAAVAALYQCILRMLYRFRRSNQRWRKYANMLISENRWRAQRYGIDQGLIDFGRGELVPFDELMDELLDMLSEDGEALNCQGELAHVRTILTQGTSAHKQREIFQELLNAGESHEEALHGVVDWLIKTTVES